MLGQLSSQAAHRRILGFYLATLVACALFDGLAEEADASARIDKSFGKNGVAEARLGFGSSLAEQTQAISVSRSGKIYVLGNQTMPATSGGPETSQIVLARLFRNGSVDRSYGSRGFVYGAKITQTRRGFGFGEALTLSNSGAALVAGPEIPLHNREVTDIWLKDCAVLGRFSAQGNVDRSFADSGRKRQCLRKPRPAKRIGLEPRSIDLTGRGRIVIGGQVLRRGRATSPFIARFIPSGELDRSLSGNSGTQSGVPGIVQVLGSRFKRGYANKILSLRNGRTLAVGTLNGELMAVKLNRDGSLDRTFANSGLFKRELDGSSKCECSVGKSAVIDSEGRILIVGSWSKRAGTSHPKLIVVRLTRNGHLDRSFGQSGVFKPTLRKDFDVSSVILQRDGRAVVSGRYSNSRRSDFALIRLKANGGLDRSFFNNGLFVPRISSLGDRATDIALDGRGRIVVSGVGSQTLPVVRIIPK